MPGIMPPIAFEILLSMAGSFQYFIIAAGPPVSISSSTGLSSGSLFKDCIFDSMSLRYCWLFMLFIIAAIEGSCMSCVPSFSASFMNPGFCRTADIASRYCSMPPAPPSAASASAGFVGAGAAAASDVDGAPDAPVEAAAPGNPFEDSPPADGASPPPGSAPPAAPPMDPASFSCILLNDGSFEICAASSLMDGSLSMDCSADISKAPAPGGPPEEAPANPAKSSGVRPPPPEPPEAILIE
mmetsp:Transcript_5696/g.13045  ORF Transcript_5696/g.13045 Transcript_5696/m.13045 type:complete len:241 (+) Transcript_5696:672-1394(+)